ncbi:MAG: amidohydrolase family protein [Nitrososphaerota archaeon]
MIIDCHTHIWNLEEHLGQEFISDFMRVWGRDINSLMASPEIHEKAMSKVDRAVVLAFKSLFLNINVPNEYVAKYVEKCPKKFIGFCSIDPNELDAASELKKCVQDLHLKGLKISPVYQNFDPNSDKAYKVFEQAQELKIPVLIHQATTFIRNAPLKYAYPSLLDDVAAKFGDLKIILAHLGHPWEDEAIVLVRKHPNVYADISALTSRPFRLYHKIMSCIEYGITDKLLFGTDFPFSTPEKTINDLLKLNKFVRGTNLPKIPANVIKAIIYENPVKIFGKI